VAQPQRDGDHQGGIPPRRQSGRQDETPQPRELAQQQKALAQQDQLAQAQQVNREGQHQRFDRQGQREV
jgi:hypothetical protein